METILDNSVTFPVVGKVPSVKGWNRLTESVPIPPGAGRGTLCGEKSGFFVVDCDLLKGDSEDEYVSGVEVWSDLVGELPGGFEYPHVRTKSGGLHVYFAWDPRVRSSVQRHRVSDLFPEDADNRIAKIDIIAGGRFIVSPPSRGYKWLDNSQYVVPPPMPGELLDLFFPETDERTSAALALRTTFRNVDKETLKFVVEGIPSKYADARDDWMRVVWAIADTAAKNGYDALEVADEFSKKSEKYEGVDDVEKMYAQSNGAVTFGTLVHLSERGLPKDGGSVNKARLLQDINTNLPLDVREITGIREENDKQICDLLTVAGEKIRISIYNKNTLTTKDDLFIGYLQKLLNIKYDLSVIHPEFKDNCEVIFIDQQTIDFVHHDKHSGEHRIRVKHPWDTKKSYFTKYSNGKQLGAMRKNKQELAVIMDDALKTACQKHMEVTYNLTVNFNINIYNQNDGKSVRSDEELIGELVKSHPGILDNFKFCDNNMGSFNGTYLYGPNTGIWRKEHNGTVEKMLSSRLRKYVPFLTEEEIKYIGTHKNIQQLRMMFVKEIIDQDFENKIDENRDVFAMSNCVFDVNAGTVRRAIPQDFVFTNCGWEYDEVAAGAHTPAVKEFFRRLFPIEEECTVVLRYIASLVHGYRLDKKFVALTDKRNGNNGKSTLIALLRRFFGDYIKTSNKFLLKGAFDKDKDSHDGGLEPMKGKRLLVCDELKKSAKLDEGLIKNLAGGEYVVEGRRLGKATQFKFVWQAGIIMIFNEGDCPKFDCTDNAFMERMVIVPMRSKFTSGEEDESTFTFRRDADIASKFDAWRPALLKLFMSYAKDRKGLTDVHIPPSMGEWKQEIVNDNNELKDWLFATVRKEEGAFVQLAELRERYRRDFPHDRHNKNKDVERMINCLFNNVGVYLKEQHKYKDDDGNVKNVRRVYVGYLIHY